MHACTVAVVVAGLTIPDVVLGHALIGTGRYTLFGGAPPGGRPNQRPGAPTGLAGRSPTTHRPALRWNAEAAAARYAVYRDGAHAATTTRPAFMDRHVGHGSHTYRVAAISAAGAEGRRSAPVTIVYQSAPPPAAPTGLTGMSPTAQPPALSWHAVPAAERYVVYRDGSMIGRPHAAAYTDAAADHGTHSYQVAYVERGDIESRLSAAITIAYTADAPPPAPTGLTARSPTRTPPSLAWNAVPGATGYTVYRDGATLDRLGATSYTDRGLAQDGTHRYTVSATGAAHVSSAPSRAITVVYDTTPPAIPAALRTRPRGSPTRRRSRGSRWRGPRRTRSTGVECGCSRVRQPRSSTHAHRSGRRRTPSRRTTPPATRARSRPASRSPTPRSSSPRGRRRPSTRRSRGRRSWAVRTTSCTATARI